MAQLTVGVVGLGFGADFVPIYRAHPDVARVFICDPDSRRLNEIGDRFTIPDRFESLEDLLARPELDAIHLLTPVPFHVEQTLSVLASGRHCACAVPMATDLDDLRRIIAAAARADKNYMMMETQVYAREFLFAQEMLDTGELGNLTFLRGTYFQDVAGDFPRYWWAMPPMHYGTHAVGPVLALAKTRASRVACLGSSRLKAEYQQPGGNVFPLQTAIFQLEGTDVAAEVTRSWFQTARCFVEGFSVYGDRKGFEWQQLKDEDPAVFILDAPNPGERFRDLVGMRVSVPYRTDLYPTELASFAHGHHGGSHPHLAHEFISSIIEGRPSRIDPVTAADWCAAGICADISSKRNGEWVDVPSFSR